MNIRQQIDNFLREHHHQLSLMALHGYRHSGRGAIPLLIEVQPGREPNGGLLRFSVRTYRRSASFPYYVFEDDFYSRIKIYNPRNRGLLVFQLEPGPLSGYLEFDLALSARMHFSIKTRRPFPWPTLRLS